MQAIVDKFAALNPYNRKIVKGSILNLVDANYVDSDPKKPQRQLYGYSIAAKRYALYEKIGKNDIKIVDPKAHGIGFLYPPKDSPKDWKEDVPQWIYEMWDYIVRGALNLKRKAPSWLEYPANDAPYHHYVQRFGNAWRMGNRSPVQFSSPADG